MVHISPHLVECTLQLELSWNPAAPVTESKSKHSEGLRTFFIAFGEASSVCACVRTCVPGLDRGSDLQRKF